MAYISEHRKRKEKEAIDVRDLARHRIGVAIALEPVVDYQRLRRRAIAAFAAAVIFGIFSCTLFVYGLTVGWPLRRVLPVAGLAVGPFLAMVIWVAVRCMKDYAAPKESEAHASLERALSVLKGDGQGVDGAGHYVSGSYISSADSHAGVAHGENRRDTPMIAHREEPE